MQFKQSTALGAEAPIARKTGETDWSLIEVQIETKSDKDRIQLSYILYYNSLARETGPLGALRFDPRTLCFRLLQASPSASQAARPESQDPLLRVPNRHIRLAFAIGSLAPPWDPPLANNFVLS